MVKCRVDQIERLRAQEESYRWQANYDLIRAQLLAFKVRLLEYGAYLGEFKKNPKKIKDKKTNHWSIPSERKEAAEEIIEEDTQYLENI